MTLVAVRRAVDYFLKHRNIVAVRQRQSENMKMFIDSLCKSDMKLDENILSNDEYQKALAGKRHFRDFSPRVSS